LVWQLADDGEAKVSLRSQGSLDVAAIAVRYGGGGHRNAAGFRMPLKSFMQEVLGRPC
jgi:nanoRNase/pAp phosphatase (c-di-AMP/oligoRNAs hydrolase)